MAEARRYVADCRMHPSANNCSLRISGTEQEVLDAAILHAVTAHCHEDTPELRESIRAMLVEEREPAPA